MVLLVWVQGGEMIQLFHFIFKIRGVIGFEPISAGMAAYQSGEFEPHMVYFFEVTDHFFGDATVFGHK